MPEFGYDHGAIGMLEQEGVIEGLDDALRAELEENAVEFRDGEIEFTRMRPQDHHHIGARLQNIEGKRVEFSRNEDNTINLTITGPDNITETFTIMGGMII